MAGLCERCMIREARSPYDLFCDECESVIASERYGHQSIPIGLPEAARRLGLHRKHLQYLARTGKIAAEKVGRDWLVSAEEVERYRLAPKDKGGRPRKEQRQ